MEVIHQGLSNAYILFCIFLGVYAVSLAGRGLPLSGNFWGAIWVNSGLVTAVLFVALIMTAQGLRPYGVLPGEGRRIRWVYYLYMIYFVISLPGLFAILRGNDSRWAGLWFGAVAFFNAAAAYRATYVLVDTWK
jgi:hypothetical protein